MFIWSTIVFVFNRNLNPAYANLGFYEFVNFVKALVPCEAIHPLLFVNCYQCNWNHMKIIKCISCFFLVLCLLSLSHASDNSKQPMAPRLSHNDIVCGVIEKRIGTLRSIGNLTVQSVKISSRTVLPALYERFDFCPVWVNEESVDQLILALETIENDGLEASDYHLSLLKKLRAQLIVEEPVSPSLVAEFDLLMSDSLVRLGYHLLMGKVDPVELDTHWNMDRTVGDLDQVVEMSRTAIVDGSVTGFIQKMRPKVKVYNHLRSALAYYRDIQVKGGWGQVAKGPTLKSGMIDSRVVSLRKRLIITDDMVDANQDDPFFDSTVEKAVKHFQKRHALVSDGMVGKNTLQALNRTVEEKKNQIRVNLERTRWVMHDLPEKFVLVDIAGFQVQYFVDKVSVFKTRSQVGTTYRKTPVFKSQITYLELNPTWTVPKTVFVEDLLPEIKQNPDYLREREMRVITYEGESIDEKTIDWSRFPERGFPYLIRQDPGPKNALGQIKFMFPNEQSVYLHDTPSRSLFDAKKRAFSSGCVRIEDPLQLAELLLDDDKWSQQELMEVIESRETKQIFLQEPVSILLLYWTVKVADDGTVVFINDIYERDQSVLAGLNGKFKFRKRPLVNQAGL